jgi:hypothetical protein
MALVCYKAYKSREKSGKPRVENEWFSFFKWLIEGNTRVPYLTLSNTSRISLKNDDNCDIFIWQINLIDDAIVAKNCV